MLNGAKFLFLTVLSAVCTKEAFSCMCMPEHPQTSFSRSDFVFRGKILSRTPIYGEFDPSTPIRIVYSIQPRPIFRNQGSSITLQNGHPVNVTTSGYQSTCGASEMQQGETYLVTAKQIGDNVIASLCSWNALFDDVNESQRKMLRDEYEQESTQSCEVRKYCDHPTCRDFQGCAYYEDNDCYVQTSYCGRRKGECVWASSWRKLFRRRYNECDQEAATASRRR